MQLDNLQDLQSSLLIKGKIQLYLTKLTSLSEKPIASTSSTRNGIYLTMLHYRKVVEWFECNLQFTSITCIKTLPSIKSQLIDSIYSEDVLNFIILIDTLK